MESHSCSISLNQHPFRPQQLHLKDWCQDLEEPLGLPPNSLDELPAINKKELPNLVSSLEGQNVPFNVLIKVRKEAHIDIE